MLNEKKYRLLNKCFEKSEIIRAKHLLYLDFKKERNDIYNMTMKIAFYMWLDSNELDAIFGKDENGNFGFGLSFINI